MNRRDWDDDDLIVYEDRCRAEMLEHQYRAIITRHPDCRDPAHPGCEHCEDRDGNPIESEEEEAA